MGQIRPMTPAQEFNFWIPPSDEQSFVETCEEAAKVAQEAGFSNFAQALRDIVQDVPSAQLEHS